MSKGKTLRIKIILEKDPAVHTVTWRFGNRWARATIRKPGGFTPEDDVRLATDAAYAGTFFDAAADRGEVWIKTAPGAPWGQFLPGKEAAR